MSDSTWKTELDKLETWKETYVARKSPAATTTAVLDAPVAFGNYSSGDKTCRIGCTVPRESLTIKKADEILCDQRLTVRLFPKPADEHPDQGNLNGMDEDPVEAVVDVKGFRVNADHITFGLTAMKKSVDRNALADLAQKSGRIVVTEVDKIEAESEPDEDDEDADDDGD